MADTGSRHAVGPRPGPDTPRRFPDPYDIPAPPGAEGWEQMYPYFNRFLDVRRDSDSARTWFRDSMHFPEPMPPFDMITCDSSLMSTGVMNTRVFALPPALGIDARVLNGYVYMSAVSVDDPAEIARRMQEFTVRVSHYYRNWSSSYAGWEQKIRAHIAALEAIQLPALQDFEPIDRVLGNRGITSANDLLVAYQAILASADAAWNLHSELLNMGYAAYLNFLTVCRTHFPEISDQSIATMVTGIDLLLWRPDDELKRLAGLAIELGVATRLLAGDTASLRTDLGRSEAGERWLRSYAESADPWFKFSYGNGLYHHHRSWSDDPTFPLTMIAEYIRRLQDGADLARPTREIIGQREAVVRQYRALIDPADRPEFDDALALSRLVFPYVENHNFFIEHWYMTTFWNKMREVGALFVRFRLFDAVDDVFFLSRSEVSDAVVDVQLAWCSGSEPVGRGHWPAIVADRRRILEVLRRWPAPPVLGPAPGAIVEPVTIMLWGITDERVGTWLAAGDVGGAARTMTGFAASPGVAEGPARVVRYPRDLDQLVEGEILVAPTTSPSWTPVFDRIAGAVSDAGGIMCHAAIIAREYGLPAVVGIGTGTTAIRTGQRIRVDGDHGTVTVLTD